ncbi:MAG: enoyl-CoA hydratase/isomerase family protein [Actinomycetota bacterium]
MSESLTLALDGPIATVTLDAGPLNIFDLAMRDGLLEALNAVADVADLGAMILRAAGAHFSAGADLREFGSAPSIHEARRIRWDRDPWGLLWDLPIPTIAALHGVTVGSGLEMALLCDLRVADRTASLGLPETKLGMLPAAGGTQSLTKAIGPHGAVPLIAIADPVGPDEALRLGLITSVVDDADATASALAEELVTRDRAAMRALKRSLRAAVDLPLDAGLALERRLAAGVAGRT